MKLDECDDIEKEYCEFVQSSKVHFMEDLEDFDVRKCSLDEFFNNIWQP